MQDKTPEQKLQEACYKYLEDYIYKPSNVVDYQGYIERKYGKQWALNAVRQINMDRKYNKQIALSVLRLIESLQNSSKNCAICGLSGDCSAFSDDEETE